MNENLCIQFTGHRCERYGACDDVPPLRICAHPRGTDFYVKTATKKPSVRRAEFVIHLCGNVCGNCVLDGLEHSLKN